MQPDNKATHFTVVRFEETEKSPAVTMIEVAFAGAENTISLSSDILPPHLTEQCATLINKLLEYKE